MSLQKKKFLQNYSLLTNCYNLTSRLISFTFLVTAQNSPHLRQKTRRRTQPLNRENTPPVLLFSSHHPDDNTTLTTHHLLTTGFLYLTRFVVFFRRDQFQSNEKFSDFMLKSFYSIVPFLRCRCGCASQHLLQGTDLLWTPSRLKAAG